MKPDWLKFKKYPHIGLPLTKKDTCWVTKYVQSPKNVATHKFTPFLHKTMSQRKFRPNENAPKNKYGKRVRSLQGYKKREIFYASHLDSILYSYYSFLLNEAYEKHIECKPFNSSVVAYRKIPIVVGKEGNRSNIEFAFDAFSFIENNKTSELSIIIADITSFFDNLNHQILLSKWKEIFNVKSLPDDHYNVYKSLINKRYVNETDLFNRFKNSLFVERGVINDSEKKIYKRKRVKNPSYLKKERVVAYCTKNEFFKTSISLVRSKKSCSHQHHRCRKECQIKGIPQGSPMSATLANIYMLDFDSIIYDEISKKNGFYQRYSDDLIIVCKRKDEKHFLEKITNAIEVNSKLEIQTKKTNLYRYDNSSGHFSGGIVDIETNTVNRNRQLEYLGFQYTGSKIYVKSIGFSKYYRGMKRAVRRGSHFASKISNTKDKLFKKRLYNRFSIRGAGRRIIWKPDLTDSSKFVPSKEQYWGNYFSYLYKANHVMKAINKDDTIKKQSSKMWNKFHSELIKAEKEILRKRRKRKP